MSPAPCLSRILGAWNYWWKCLCFWIKADHETHKSRECWDCKARTVAERATLSQTVMMVGCLHLDISVLHPLHYKSHQKFSNFQTQGKKKQLFKKKNINNLAKFSSSIIKGNSFWICPHSNVVVDQSGVHYKQNDMMCKNAYSLKTFWRNTIKKKHPIVL